MPHSPSVEPLPGALSAHPTPPHNSHCHPPVCEPPCAIDQVTHITAQPHVIAGPTTHQLVVLRGPVARQPPTATDQIHKGTGGGDLGQALVSLGLGNGERANLASVTRVHFSPRMCTSATASISAASHASTGHARCTEQGTSPCYCSHPTQLPHFPCCCCYYGRAFSSYSLHEELGPVAPRQQRYVGLERLHGAGGGAAWFDVLPGTP